MRWKITLLIRIIMNKNLWQLMWAAKQFTLNVGHL